MLELLGLSFLLLGTITDAETTNCSTTCLEDTSNTTESCNVTSGECLYGCVTGYVGPNCSTECSVNCALPPMNESYVCDFKTGNCTFGCKTGYAGLTCSCPENCFIDKDRTNETCDAVNGTCSLGCKQGYAGPNCSFECPSKCGSVTELGKGACNITSGECSYGCLPGYAGPNCSTVCPSNCYKTVENNTDTCIESTKECLHGCNLGFAGSTCSFECPENCRISTDNKSETCNVSSGECLLGCQYGYAGPNCTFECPSKCGISDDLYTQTCNESSENCFFGCIQGYAGSNCSVRCPANCVLPLTNNSETCDDTTGSCSLGCMPGYAGPNCSFECPGNCSHSLQNNTDTCDYLSGQCLHGCLPGLAGSDCSFVCPTNCLLPTENGTETCNNTTGLCSLGCKLGYAGPNCSVECPQNCASSNISGDEICNATSKECDFGCKEGSYGDRCEQKCSAFNKNCKKCSLNNENSVVCDECKRDFYRDSGTCKSCNYWCKKIFNHALPLCRENDGYCNLGCAAGRYGFKCGLRCSGTCNNTCHRDTGICLDGCKYPNYCGQTCELSCNDGCVSQQCNVSCTCTEGCTSARWGEQCKNHCNTTCNGPPDSSSNICERSNGYCSYGCNNDNFWGSQCEKPCSSNCVGKVCDQSTGNCAGGCKSKKVYGVRCNMTCNDGCVNDTCERIDGYCDNGCVPGRYGDRCYMRCNDNCLDSICNRENGSCEDGCTAGTYGERCEKTCSLTCFEEMCERKSGNCSSCISGYEGPQCGKVSPITTNGGTEPPPTDWIYLAIGCGALVLLGVMTTIVLVTKKRRKIARRKRVDRMSKIPDEKFLEEAQMRHRRKADGAGARITQLFVENPLARFMKYRSHGGALITKIPIDELLRKVIKMDENDYGREFDEFSVGLTKSHEVSRKLDNLSLNFFNGIYPYDENRVVLRHSLEEDVTRKSKPRPGILKSVHFTTFGPTRSADYETLAVGDHESPSSDGEEEGTEADVEEQDTEASKPKEKDKSNGYASVVFDIKDETDIPDQKEDGDISDDYATVEVGGSNNPSSSTSDNIELNVISKVSAGENIETSAAGQQNDVSCDYAVVDKERKTAETAGNELANDQSNDYAVVNKEKDAKPSTPEETEDDEPYAVVHKGAKEDAVDAVDTNINKKAAKTDGSVVIQKDYINASFIKGHNLNEKYIAAQAPSKLTANNFWLMVWEQKSHFVIMLTVIPEDGYSRCEKYWPDEGDDQTFGDIKVTGEDVHEYADYIIRMFKMSLKNGIERDVIHMQFTAWPDEGCPVSAIEFIEFHQKYRSMTKGRHAVGPAIVHCTAGIGRTGVFIALDILVEEGLDTLSVDVAKCVTALREQRVDMVHSIEQYEFLYKVLAQTFALECQPYHKVRLQDKLAELKKFDHNSGKTKLEVLYDNIKTSLGLDTAEIATIDVVQERKVKDRPKSDVPDVLFRAGLPHNAYINAVIYESSKKREAMVATQMPTPDTVQDFCQLLIHHQCATVVMLNNIDPNDKTIGAYWPTGKTPFVAGKTIITQLDVEKQSDYIIRQLRIHNPELGDENPAQPVTMIQYKGWKIVKNVPNAKNLLKLLQLCQRYIKDTPDKRLLVHCMNGAEQSGLFCALVNLLEEVDTEDEISVTSVVRKILARRPNAIPTVDQFEMCFSTTCEYIKKA